MVRFGSRSSDEGDVLAWQNRSQSSGRIRGLSITSVIAVARVQDPPSSQRTVETAVLKAYYE